MTIFDNFNCIEACFRDPPNLNIRLRKVKVMENQRIIFSGEISTRLVYFKFGPISLKRQMIYHDNIYNE